MSIVNKIDGAIERMSNWKHNSQDWDAETFKYIEPVYEEIHQLEQRLKDAEEVIAFYANELIGSSCPASDCEHSKDGAWEYIGGKRARDYMKRYNP